MQMHLVREPLAGLERLTDRGKGTRQDLKKKQGLKWP